MVLYHIGSSLASYFLLRWFLLAVWVAHTLYFVTQFFFFFPMAAAV